MKISIKKLKIPHYLRNFYVVSSLVFFVWMLFFEQDNFRIIISNKLLLNDLNKQKGYYEEKISEVEKDRKELLTNPKLIEKYARERYFMKKPTEDIYIVEREE